MLKTHWNSGVVSLNPPNNELSKSLHADPAPQRTCMCAHTNIARWADLSSCLCVKQWDKHSQKSSRALSDFLPPLLLWAHLLLFVFQVCAASIDGHDLHYGLLAKSNSCCILLTAQLASHSTHFFNWSNSHPFHIFVLSSALSFQHFSILPSLLYCSVNVLASFSFSTFLFRLSPCYPSNYGELEGVWTL